MFSYHPDIIDRFPTIQAGVVHATGLINESSPDELANRYRAEQLSATRRLEATPIAELGPIAAWRRVFSQFGVQPTRHRNAAESLLRRLSKHGDVPTINTLVDIGNLVSIRYAMPVAVLDVAGIDTTITVRQADGTESFTDLGSTEVTHPKHGEVIFVDRAGVVCARRWCWRQSANSATSGSTTEALIVIEGHHDTARTDIDSAIDDVRGLLASHLSQARLTTHRLSAGSPGIG